MLSRLLSRVDPLALLSFLIPLGGYLVTLAPSVTFFDSGEFITAIACLGSPHSPGYPLFVNYAKPFTYLPLGNIAFKVNIATAVSGALACYGAFLLTRFLLADDERAAMPQLSPLFRDLAALAAALAFAFTPRLWLQSNHDKPYPLVSFIAVMVLYLVLCWRKSSLAGEERPAYVYLGAFLCGLATGAHQTIVLMIPAYAFIVLVTDWRVLTRIKEILLALSFAILGFAINLHLPLRATRNPILNWADPRTLDQFLWHFLRKGYPVEKPVRDLKLLWQQINAFNVPHEFTIAGMVLLLLGMVYLFTRKRWIETVAYLLGLGAFLLVIVGYFNTPGELIFLTEEFFTPLYCLSAAFIGLGLWYLTTLLLTVMPVLAAKPLAARLLVPVVLFALPTGVFAINFVENDQHDNYVAYDYATNTLRSAPQGSVLYTWGDSGAFPLWYLQGVERMREDLDLLHTPHLVFKWYLDAFPELFRNSLLRHIPLESQSPENVLLLSVAEQIPRRPVLIDFSTRYSVPFDAYRFLQRGIAYQLVVAEQGEQPMPDMMTWRLYNNRGFTTDMFFRDLDTQKAFLIYANGHLEAGESLLRLGRKGEGVAEVRLAEQIAPEMSYQVRQTLNSFGIR